MTDSITDRIIMYPSKDVLKTMARQAMEKGIRDDDPNIKFL